MQTSNFNVSGGCFGIEINTKMHEMLSDRSSQLEIGQIFAIYQWMEIRNDKDGNLSSTIGRKSFSSEKLLENYNYFIESLKKEKPETRKGEFIKNTFITSTMGISYKVGAK